MAIQSRRAGAPESGAAPWVVKLGGSLSLSPRLAEWLEALAASDAPLAVVPGGGRFADRVREAQAHWRFDESAAHHMALLAMDQTGRMFAAIEPRLRICSGMEDFRTAFADGKPAVWMPTAMALGQNGIGESWGVTSDSLAAWLAGRIGACGVLLVKSVEPPGKEARAADLARDGLVDTEFGRYLADSGIDGWCVGPGGAAQTVAAMPGGHVPGCRVLIARPTGTKG